VIDKDTIGYFSGLFHFSRDRAFMDLRFFVYASSFITAMVDLRFRFQIFIAALCP